MVVVDRRDGVARGADIAVVPPLVIQPAAEKRRSMRKSVIGDFRSFDQFPKLRVLLERFVLLHLQPRAEEEILQGVSVQNAVDHEPKFMALEVHPVITSKEAAEKIAPRL